MRKPKQVWKETDDDRVLRTARKEKITREEGECPRCPWHRLENQERVSKSWKDRSRRRKQWKS